MLARKSTLIVLNNTLGAAFGVVSLFFIARHMPPASLGMVAFALAVARVGTIIGDLGLEAAHVKRVSEGQDIADCQTTYAVLRGGLLLLSSGLLTAAAIWWQRTRGFTDATTLTVLLVLIVFQIIQGIRSLPFQTFTALTQTARAQVILLADNLVKAPALIGAALVFGVATGRTQQWFPFLDVPQGGPIGVEVGAIYIALAYILGAVASTVIGAGLLLRARYGFGRFRMDLARSYARFAAPLALLSFVTYFATEVDTLMVGYFWGATDTGHYHAAKRLATMASIIPVAVGSVFFPMISELAAKGETGVVATLMRTALRYVALFMLPLLALAVLFADGAVRVALSADFGPTALILQILTLHVVIQALGTVYGSTVRGLDRPRLILFVGVVSFGVNVALNLLFIPDSILGVPTLGLKGAGAAAATVIATATTVGILVIWARRTMNAWVLPPGLWKMVVAAGAMVLIFTWLLPLPVIGAADRLVELLVYAVLVGLGYLLILWALRGLDRNDVIMVRDAVHPRELASYVRRELLE